ncbi:hypothetical protein ABGB19_24350 [Mycobacterium sp. B14F4]|uniref:hypothetical protein n=1 Tax=Mycobacterium sp. B14F4 TaxID=3153565 RepID=UPI00325F38E6
MSYVTDAASKINEFQLKIVAEGQDTVVELVKQATGYLDRKQEAPRAVQDVVEPFESLVGNPAEVFHSIAENNKEWAHAWLDFHTRISEVLTPVVESAAAAPTPIKKSNSARKANA